MSISAQIIKDPSELKKLALQLRIDVLKMVMSSHEGHLGAAFSCMEILVALYFNILNIKPLRPEWNDRDRFIMSKGHGCFALYAVLARRGFFSADLLDTVKQKGTIFGGHPDRDRVIGVDVSTGSLGHGLSIGSGMALAAKADGKNSRVFVLLGDGECQEGSVWEAAMFASASRLDNLIAIVDANCMQATGMTNDIISMEPFAGKWKSFGWEVFEIDGHNCYDLLNGLSKIPVKTGSPTVFIAQTVKGKGVSYMENEIMWHARSVTEKEFHTALFELESSIKLCEAG